MTDNMMPELTLTPDDTATAAAVEVPSLTLTPEAPEVPKEEEKKIEPVEMDDKLLTEEEKQAVEAFSHKIDIRDTNQVLQYGAAAQKSVASFSENALNNVRSKDMGEIGEDLSRLVVELKGFGEEDEKKGLFGLFRRDEKNPDALEYCIMVKADAALPEGWTEIVIPKTTWAVFDCVGPVPQAIQNGWRFLQEEWLGNYPFEHANCPELEWYSDGNAYAADYGSQILIPVADGKQSACRQTDRRTRNE